MKKITYVFSILLFLFSLLLFVYGSMKYVEAAEKDPTEIDLGEGLNMQRDSQEEIFSTKAFTLAGVTFVAGLGTFLFARGIKK